MQIPDKIKLLVSRYLDGTATDEEKMLLDDWYQSFHDEEVAVHTKDGTTKEQLEDRLRHRLLQTIGATQRPPKSTVIPLWLRSAAAIVLIITGIAIFIIARKSNGPSIDNAQPGIVTQPIVPGTEKATLTLADGSVIALDSMVNGIISQQGNIKVRKLSNGQLIYTVNGKEITSSDQEFYNTISTPRGGQYQVTLADGTRVWLNAASSIRFPIIFTGTHREINITGEAYLEVAHDKNKPFIVHTPSSQTEVLGTHFNINTYDDEPEARTTLVEGSIKVQAKNIGTNQSKIISPGQQAIISSEKMTIVPDADISAALAWKNGHFKYKSADIQFILRQISRWYDVDVKYMGDVDMHFSGQIPRNEEVEKVFEILALTGKVQFEAAGRTIYVTPQNKK